ncbi:hypothetical protein BG000_008416 [Podila horticola]|nr:hypothetical protein BG000_008416 [Podila horticola]
MVLSRIFLVDLWNFSFWSQVDIDDTGVPHPERYRVTLDGVGYTGYWSMVAAVNRALREGIPITTPEFFASEEKLPDSEIERIFRSDTKEQIPLLKERIRILREAGRVLVENQSYGAFKDIDEITMFADYRVPQALYHFHCLQYSPELLAILDRSEMLPYGSPLEVEIRGNSIWSVELIRRRILELIDDEVAAKQKDSSVDEEMPKMMTVNAILIDFFIWDFAKATQLDLTLGQRPVKAAVARGSAEPSPTVKPTGEPTGQPTGNPGPTSKPTNGPEPTTNKPEATTLSQPATSPPPKSSDSPKTSDYPKTTDAPKTTDELKTTDAPKIFEYRPKTSDAPLATSPIEPPKTINPPAPPVTTPALQKNDTSAPSLHIYSRTLGQIPAFGMVLDVVYGMLDDYLKNLHQGLAGADGVIGQAVSGLKSLIAIIEGMGKVFTDELKLPVDAITKILDILKPLLATLQALTDCFHGPKACGGILPFLGYALEFATPLIRAKEPPLPLLDGMIDEIIKVIQAGTRQISQGAAGALASLTSTLKTLTAPLMLVPVLRLLLKLLFEVLDHAGDCYEPGIVPQTLSPLPFTIPTALFITIPHISTVLPTLPITQVPTQIPTQLPTKLPFL